VQSLRAQDELQKQCDYISTWTQSYNRTT